METKLFPRRIQNQETEQKGIENLFKTFLNNWPGYNLNPRLSGRELKMTYLLRSLKIEFSILK